MHKCGRTFSVRPVALWSYKNVRIIRCDGILHAMAHLVVRNSTSADIEHSLQMLTPYDSHKTLGHYKEPSGTQKEQATQLKKLCQEAVDFLWKYPITRAEAWTFYTACFIPKVTYPLLLYHFEEPELQ
jgi:hypothetical protein